MRKSTRYYCTRTIEWRFKEGNEELKKVSNENMMIIHPDDAVKYFGILFKGLVKERFIVLWLASSNRVQGFEIITEGILNSSLTHPREIFRGAIVATSASVVLMHNHPSGQIEPSQEDIQITKQLSEAGKILGIPVFDHIIIGSGDKYTSLAERGIL